MQDQIKNARELREEIYKEYGHYHYVPMPEANNLQIPVTVGCSYGKCLYCDLNGHLPFRSLSIDEIKRKIDLLKELYKNFPYPPHKALLIGGNPLVIPSEKLIDISNLITKAFPTIDYISSFARADDILRKSDRELETLKNHKFDHFSLGLESGSDEVLSFHKKGVSSQENLASMVKLEKHGLNYSSYVILGLGGKEKQASHIFETIKLFEGRKPTELDFLSLVLFKNAPLVKMVRAKKFIRLNTVELMEEELVFAKNLNLKTIFNGTHKNNAFPVKGRLPEQRRRIVDRIEREIEVLKNSYARDHEAKRWKSWTNE